MLDARVPDRGGALLAVDDPTRPLFLIEGDGQRPLPQPGLGAVAVCVGCFEADAWVEGDDDPVGDHRPLGLDIGADRVDVREHLRPLVAADRSVLAAANARDGGEAMQQLAVDAEGVDLARRALRELQGRDAQFCHAAASSLWSRSLKMNRL